MNKPKLTTIFRYARGVLFLFGLPVLLFLIAGKWDWWQGWVYIGIIFIASLANRIVLTKVHPDLMLERINYSEKKDIKPWDKVLMPLLAMVFPAAYFITAGFDQRFGWSGEVPLWLYLTALAITVAAFFLGTWALVENRFFSAVVRIQTERGHTVVETGPYRFIRHPGYASAAFIALMFPIMVGSWWSYIPAGFMVIAGGIRTFLEDRTLIAELPGYLEYTHKTRYRLIPGIW